MFQNSTTILRLFGIQIKIAATWFLIAALITWSLADHVFPAEVPGLSALHYFVLGLITMLLFFASLLLHELAHAMVAKSFGINVPRITLFLFGGVAELGDEPDTPNHEVLIALAGPAMSLTLAITFWFLSGLASVLSAATAEVMLSHLAAINLILAAFNLLPAFPLDGGRVLRAVIWRRTGDALIATERAALVGGFLAYGLIAIGLVSLFQGLHLAGAWQILIGTFILLAARAAIETQRARSLLGQQMVQDLMSTTLITARPEVSLTDLVDHIMLPNRVSFVPVVEDDRLFGHIDTEVLAKIDRENWPTTLVEDVFVALEAERAVSPETLAVDVLGQFSRTGHRKLFVVNEGELVGIITLADLGRTLHLLTALHTRSAPSTYQHIKSE